MKISFCVYIFRRGEGARLRWGWAKPFKTERRESNDSMLLLFEILSFLNLDNLENRAIKEKRYFDKGGRSSGSSAGTVGDTWNLLATCRIESQLRCGFSRESLDLFVDSQWAEKWLFFLMYDKLGHSVSRLICIVTNIVFYLERIVWSPFNFLTTVKTTDGKRRERIFEKESFKSWIQNPIRNGQTDKPLQVKSNCTFFRCKTTSDTHQRISMPLSTCRRQCFRNGCCCNEDTNSKTWILHTHDFLCFD